MCAPSRAGWQESVESLWTSRNGADVELSLGRRGELDDAVRGERWTSEGSSNYLSGAFGGHEGE